MPSAVPARSGDVESTASTLAWLVRFNTGYAVDEDDWADVSALHARFGVPIPDDYAKFADARAGA